MEEFLIEYWYVFIILAIVFYLILRYISYKQCPHGVGSTKVENGNVYESDGCKFTLFEDNVNWKYYSKCC